MAEFEFQRLVLQILNSLVRSPVVLLFNDVRLQVGQFLQALLSTFDHDIPRLLKCNVMLALRMLEVLRLVLLEQGMLECLLSSLLGRDHSKVFEECLLEILALDFLQVEIGFQAVIQLLLVRKQLVRHLNDRVVVPEAVRVEVGAELVRDKALEVVLDVQDELSLEKRLFEQKCFDQEDVDELSDAEHEANFG